MPTRQKYLIVLLFVFGCVSVPKNSPVLNDKISKGIVELEKQHLQAIDAIYKLSIDRVNSDFETFLDLAKEDFKKKNGRYPEKEIEYYKVALIAVQTREEVIRKIRIEVDEVRKKVISNYALIKSMNDEVTIYLNSAVKVKESQNKVNDFIQEKTGIDLDIDNEITNLNNAIDDLIKGE